jgi:hypothetical protein
MAMAICGGSTCAIIGTVNSGVPTPRAPLMNPPQVSAKKHQAMIQIPYSASKVSFQQQSAALLQLASFARKQESGYAPALQD